jgi:hypothetical protein
MSSSRGFVVLLLAGVLAGNGPAAEVEPERLLPATTQVYVRWDGVEAHRKAYTGSAFGRMLQGELGKSIATLWGRLEDELTGEGLGERLLEGEQPRKLLHMHEVIEAGLRLPRALAATGIVAGLEFQAVPSTRELLPRLGRALAGKATLADVLEPTAQLTVIVPGAKGRPEFTRLLDWLAAGKLDIVKMVKMKGRTCYVSVEKGGNLQWAVWLEGKHLVAVLCPADPVAAVHRVLNAGAGLTRHPLYASLRKFRDFEVTTRGFIDGKAVAANIRLARRLEPQLVAALEETGLLDVQAVRFWEGFESEASRSVWEATIPSRRRGLTRLLVPRAVRLKDLPPVPADAQRWTAGRADVTALYDVLLTLATAMSRGSEPFGKAKRRLQREVEEELEPALGGVKIGDLLGSLGDTFLTYSSPGDGLLSLGQVGVVAVKDERRLGEALDALGKKLQSLGRDEVRFRKRPFHGAVIRELSLGRRPSIPVCWTIHKGWLAVGVQSQPVQGFVLRCRGKLPAWKPDRRTAKALARVPEDAGLVQVVDPRPPLKLLLSGAPWLASFARADGLSRVFEPGDLPHAGEVTGHLFPNVSWTRFDGTTFRIESRESLWLPLQEVGFEWLLLAGL